MRTRGAGGEALWEKGGWPGVGGGVHHKRREGRVVSGPCRTPLPLVPSATMTGGAMQEMQPRGIDINLIGGMREAS